MSLPTLTPSSGQNTTVTATRNNLSTSVLGNSSITSVRSGAETLQTSSTTLTTAQAQQAITRSGLMNILRSLGYSTTNLDESAQPVRQQNMGSPPAPRTSPTGRARSLIETTRAQSGALTTAAAPPRPSQTTQNNAQTTAAAPPRPSQTAQNNPQTTAAAPLRPNQTTQNNAQITAAAPPRLSQTTQNNAQITAAAPPRLSHSTQNSALTSSSSPHTPENNVQSARSTSFGGARARTGANHQAPTATGIWARTTQARTPLNTGDNPRSLNTPSKITNSPPESASSLAASSRCPELHPQDIICSVPVKLALESVILLDNFDDLDYENPDETESGNGSGSGSGSDETLSAHASGTGPALGQRAKEKPAPPPSNYQCPIVLHRPDKRPTGADNSLLSCAKMLEQANEKPSCKKEAIEQCSGLLHRAAHKNKHHCQKIKSSLTRHRNNYHPELQEEFANLNCAHKPNLRSTAPSEPSMTPTEVTTTTPLPTSPSSWLPTYLSSASILGICTGISILGCILKLYSLSKKVLKACINPKDPV